jgi:hypothetical protein
VFLQVPSRTWFFFAWFVDATVGAVDGDDEDLFIICDICFPEPFDLAAKRQSGIYKPNEIFISQIFISQLFISQTKNL